MGRTKRSRRNLTASRPPRSSEINIPENEKKNLFTFVAKQFLSKILERFSAHTDNLRNLLNMPNDWIRTEEHTKAFNNLRKLIVQLPWLAHYHSNSGVVSTRAAKEELEQHCGNDEKTET